MVCLGVAYTVLVLNDEDSPFKFFLNQPCFIGLLSIQVAHPCVSDAERKAG